MWRSADDPRVVRLLELDPDLAVDLDAEALEAAGTELVAPVVSVDWRRHRGRWGPPNPQGHLGLLIVEGLLVRELRLLTTHSAEVLGQGDLLRPWDADGEFVLPVPAQIDWIVLVPVRVAVLGPTFLGRAARFPETLARLAARGVGRAKGRALHDAVTNLRHVETRLLVLFWHLAERWGRVQPESVAIPVPLTHELVAKLVGATRPSVTAGLGRLAARGLLVRDPSGTWQLGHDSRDALHPMPVQPDTRLTD